MPNRDDDLADVETEVIFGCERDGEAIRFTAVIPPLLSHDAEFRVETSVPRDVALDWLLNDLQVVLSAGFSVDEILAVERRVKAVKAAVMNGGVVKDVPASLQRNGELLRTELAMREYGPHVHSLLDNVLIQQGQSNDLARALATLPPELELTEKRVHDHAVMMSRYRNAAKAATIKLGQEFLSTVDLVGKTVASVNGKVVSFRNEDELRGIITATFADWFDVMSLGHAEDVGKIINAKVQGIRADHHHSLTCASIVAAAIGRCFEQYDSGMMFDEQELEALTHEFQEFYTSTQCRYLQRNGLRGLFVGGDAHGAIASRLSGFLLEPHVEIVPIPGRR